MITRTDILAHLEYGMKKSFLKAGQDYTPLRSGWVREAPSSGAFELYGDMGAVPWPSANAGQAPGTATDSRTGAVQVGGLNAGEAIKVLGANERSIMVYNRDWDIAYGIEHNAINDDRGGADLEQWARMSAVRFEQHKDYLCFQALNAGAAATYGKTYDGQVFFYASHADPGAEYSTAQSNVNTSALTLDSFETVYIAACKYLDDRGIPVGYTPSLLLHAVDLTRTAAQITDNYEDYMVAERARNPWAGQIRRLAAPGGWLDTTAWYLVVTDLPQKPVNLQTRQGPQLVYWDDHTQGNGIRYYKWVARYEVFYGDWRLCTQGQS